jgi:hypothetical protein
MRNNVLIPLTILEEGFMKRKLSVLLAALMVFAVAGQAAAYFEDYHLIRAIYKVGSSVEVLNDLGLVGDLIGQTNKKVGFGTLETNLSDFGQGTTFDQLRVAYFAIDDGSASPHEVWLAGPAGGASSQTRKYGNITGAWANIQTYYSGLAGTGTGEVKTTGVQSDPLSYYSKMNLGGTGIGQFNLFYPVGTSGEESLAALASGGVVEQYLYYFSHTGTSSAFPVTPGVNVAMIQTYLDAAGSAGTIINPAGAAVPVPAAVWLLGTGVIGLVGIRRRKS